jgi:molybdate transport system substrate-binding protein
MSQRVTLTIAVLTALAFVVSGCSSDSEGGSGSSVIPSSFSGTIIVSAAASLRDSFTTIKDDFVEDHPDAHITINFGSSGALSTQIREGAPADVTAFADTTPMTTLQDAGLLAAAPKTFARNQMIIVTKPGNPQHITSLDDLANAGTISLCVDTAPCGTFADQILTTAGVTIPEGSVSRGTDVKSTLTAVSEGDAIAGIVYVTDAASVADLVHTVDIAESDNVIASYPIAVVATAANSGLAQAFEAYVLGDEGQAVLEEAGFLAP